MSKRGNISLILLPILVAVFIFTYLLIAQSMPSVIVGLNSSFSNNVSNKIMNTGISLIEQQDNMIVIVIFILIIGIIIEAILLKSHPLIFIASVILWIIAIFFAMNITNLTNEFINQTSINQTIQLFPAMEYIIDNLPLIIIFIGIVVLIVMYATSRSSL